MGKHILLLHGALGSAAQWKPLEPLLHPSFIMHRFSFTGHGGLTIPDQISMQDLADQVKEYILKNIPADVSLTLFGYSMGGYAALLFAAQNNHIPLERIITLGTKLYWNVEVAKKEILMLDPEMIKEKIPAFALELEKRHHPSDWKLLLNKTAFMMEDLGAHQYLNDETFSQIAVPCKLMLGDKDKMVSLDETLNAFKAIKNASLSILPSTSHPIEKLNLQRLVFELEN
jgi:pimeloyl-ACP methyl ester carboxylesterase